MLDYNELLAAFDGREFLLFQSLLLSENEVDIATFLEEIPNEKAIVIFRMLPKDIAAEVFSNLFSETQQAIVESMTDLEIGRIINELYVDDAVDFIEEMPAGIVKRVLQTADKQTRENINHILKYPENSAGSRMTVEFLDMKRNLTAAQAIERIRKIGSDSVTINTCYITDATRHLEGILSLRRLLMASPTALLEDLMRDEYVYVNTTDDQESVAHLFERYDLVAIPVVDSEQRLVGIITIDDILDVMQEEATEDIEIMAAMRPSEKPYLKTGVLSLARNRITWLLVLMFSGMVTGRILENFESAIATVPLLVTFIPMLTDTGGNAGSQSSTMVIRGMTLREIKNTDFFRVWRKELAASLVVGVLLSVINYVRVCLQYPGQRMVALTLAISLLCTVVIAQTLGGVLPIIAKRLKLDPAVMAAPLITTVVDAFALVIFFLTAQRLLHI